MSKFAASSLARQSVCRLRTRCRSSCALLARSEDERDIHIPLLLWWRLEAKSRLTRGSCCKLFLKAELWNLPIVKRTVIERLMRPIRRGRHQTGLERLRQAARPAPGPEHVKRLMAGFESAYAGRPLAGLPPELVDALAKFSGESITLGLRRGKSQAISDALRMLADPRADRARLLQTLQTLGEVRIPVAVPAMLRLACESADNALRSAALTALTGYDDPAIAPVNEGLFQHARRRAGRGPDHARLPPALGDRIPQSHRRLGALDAHGVPREIVEKLTLLGDPAINSTVTRRVGSLETRFYGRTSRQDRPFRRHDS